MKEANKIILYLALALAAVMICGTVGAVYGIAGRIFDFSGKDNEQMKMKKFDVGTSAQSIDIDIGTAKLVINSGDTLSVESDCDRLEAENRNGVLTVEEKKSVFKTHREECHVNITLPENCVFDSVSIDCGAGSVIAEGLHCADLEANIGAGKAELNNISVSGDSDIDCGAGMAKISEASLNNLDLNLGAGKLELKGRLSGKNFIDCGAGAAEIVLHGKPDDYCITADRGAGVITIGGENTNKGGVYGNGDTTVEVNGGAGRMSVSFSED